MRETSEKLSLLMTGKGHLKKFAKGQVIQTTDDQTTFNFIESGYVKRYLIRNDGALTTDLIYGPKDVFSLSLIFRTLYDGNIPASKETYYYGAITDTAIYALDIQELSDYALKDPLIYKALLREAGKRMISATQALENKSIKNSYKRTAHQLAYYARRFGYRRSSGIEILPPLTHQDLADILILTRETISTSMSRLKQQKLIKTNKNIAIPNLDKLEELADS